MSDYIVTMCWSDDAALWEQLRSTPEDKRWGLLIASLTRAEVSDFTVNHRTTQTGRPPWRQSDKEFWNHIDAVFKRLRDA
jgi:hypothetical protein